MKTLLLLLMTTPVLCGAGFQAINSAPLTLHPDWFWQGQEVGNMDNTYTEYSGLAPGMRSENLGYLWAVQDGATGYLIAIDRTNAASAGQITLSGVSTSDVEDLDGQVYKGQPYLYLADTGDNSSTRSTFKIFRIKEPVITRSGFTLGAGEIEEIVCEFPSGDVPSHKDVETVMADPHTGDVYVITKRISPVKCYRLNYAASYTGTNTLDDVGDLTSDGTFNTISTTVSGNNGYATAGCMSPNGRELVIKSYDTIYLFQRDLASQSVIDALQTTPLVVAGYIAGGEGLRSIHPGSEPQGEGICFDAHGRDLYHCSEYVSNRGSTASDYPLYRMERLDREYATHSFQQGTDSYTGGADTYVDDGAPTTDNSAATTTICDFNYSSYPTVNRYRIGLHYWDISSIDSGQVVVDAYLEAYINTEGLGVAVHRMLTNWTDSVTWNGLGGSDFRDDIRAASSPSVNPQTSAGNGWDTYTGPIHINLPLDLVQAWVTTSATNHGLAIFGPDESSGDGLQLRSNDHATTADRPRLVVRTVAPE